MNIYILFLKDPVSKKIHVYVSNGPESIWMLLLFNCLLWFRIQTTIECIIEFLQGLQDNYVPVPRALCREEPHLEEPGEDVELKHRNVVVAGEVDGGLESHGLQPQADGMKLVEGLTKCPPWHYGPTVHGRKGGAMLQSFQHYTLCSQSWNIKIRHQQNWDKEYNIWLKHRTSFKKIHIQKVCNLFVQANAWIYIV